MTCTKTTSKSIFFTSQGTVKALHSGLLDKLIRKLGKATVERASTVEWNHDLQMWVATIAYDGKQFYSEVREEVLRLEEQYINDLLRRDLI